MILRITKKCNLCKVTLWYENRGKKYRWILVKQKDMDVKMAFFWQSKVFIVCKMTALDFYDLFMIALLNKAGEKFLLLIIHPL